MITLKKVHKLTKELAKRNGFVNTKKSMSKLTNTLLLGSKYNPIALSFFVDKPLSHLAEKACVLQKNAAQNSEHLNLKGR